MEIGLLQLQQFELTSALKNVNLTRFSRELCKFRIIQNQAVSDFISLDERVESTVKVRYLIQLVCDKVCQENWLFDSVLKILKSIGELKSVGENLEKLYNAKEPTQVQVSDRILTEQDIPVLMNELASVAHRWKDIGVALNVPITKLKDISKEESSKIKLYEILNVWIVEGTLLKPVSLTKFKEILKGPIVELPAIADKLCFINPLPSSNRLCLDITPNIHERVLSQSLDTVVGYGKPTLLEVQVHSNKPVTYQWTKDGQPLLEGTSYQGTSSSILLVSHRNMASQHIEGRYVCEVEGIGRSREIAVTIEYPDRIQCLLDKYIPLSEVPKDTWPPVGTESFVELALIKRESNNLKEYDYSVRGDMDDILSKKEKISYKECFGKYISGVLLVVEGRPGVGKTTLAHKVTRDWSTGGNVLVGADLVFLVSLRILNVRKRDSNLSELLEDLFNAVDGDLMKYLESQKGNKSCFILDGLDEYQNYSNKNNIICDLISKTLSKAMVIVFSRPVGNKKLKNCGDKRIEILGFKRGQIDHYISTYFQNEPDKADHLKKYLDLHINVLHMCYLPVHAAMICYIYTQCKADNIPVPNTETEIYERFTLLTIIRKIMQEENSDTPTSLQHLNAECKDYFKKICELAFRMTVNSEQVFERKDTDPKLSDQYDSDGPSLGLVTVDSAAKLYKIQDFYTFLHLTFQEYLAAYHLFSQPEDQQLNIIDQHKENAAMLVVWKFYCGLMGQQTQIFHKQVQTIFSSKHADILYRVHCAFESQQSVACDAVIDYGEQQQSSLSFKEIFFTPSDYNAIGYVISEATHPTLALEFYSCRLQESGVEHLILTSSHRLGEIKTFIFHSETSELNQFSILNSLLSRMKSLEILDLLKTSLFLKAIETLATNVTLQQLKCLIIQLPVILPFRPKINIGRILNFLGFGCNLGTINYFLSADELKEIDLCNFELRKSPNLNFYPHCTSFNLVNCGIEDDMISSLAEALKKCNSVEKLVLDFNRISGEGATALVPIISNLKHLSMKCNFIDDRGAKSLASGLLQGNTDLVHLDLECNSFGDEGAIAIASAVRHLDISLYLWNAKITEEGATSVLGYVSSTNVHSPQMCDFRGIDTDDPESYSRALECCTSHTRIKYSVNSRPSSKCEERLKSFKNLRELQLICEISDEENKHFYRNTLVAFESVEGFVNLQELTIIGSGYSFLRHWSEIAVVLATSLKSCTNLQTLEISNNSIGSEGTVALADGLKSCTNLQTLNISKNSIGSEGAVALADDLKSCINLQTLGISLNGIGSEGAVALADGLKSCTNLQTLNINYNSIGSVGAVALADGLKSCTNLQTLNISLNSIGSEGAVALADGIKSCTNLQTLNISYNSVGSEGAVALADNLKSCTNLQTLDISYNLIGSEGAVALAGGLKSCTNLQTLNISKNSIGSQGAVVLADGLKSCTNLQTLDISDSSIDSEGAVALADGLKSFTNLQTLDISYNLIGSKGAVALAGDLKSCTNLQTLYISKNSIGSQGAVALADGLKSCTNLQTLNISKNSIDSQGAVALADGLKSCTNLQTLNIE